MPNVLADPPPFLHLLVIACLVTASLIWYRYRTRKTQIALFAVLSLALVFYIISIRYLSPREHAIHRVESVIAAMNRYDSASAIPHVSDRFNYRGAKKSALQNAQLTQILRERKAVISPWGYSREDVVTAAGNESCTIGFNVNVSGVDGSRPGFHVKATVIKDADGEYRLSGFKVFENSLQGTNSAEFVVPGVGP